MLDKSNKKLLHEKGAAVNNKALFMFFAYKPTNLVQSLKARSYFNVAESASFVWWIHYKSYISYKNCDN